MAKKKADNLRKQQQVYDEFSPNGPITDHEPYMYDDGQAYLGEEIWSLTTQIHFSFWSMNLGLV